MWALIENNEVRETTEVDPSGRFHAEFVWIPCPLSVHQGWRFDSGEFSPPPEIQLLVPSTCTPAQGLVALFALKGIAEDDVLSVIAQIPDEVQRYTARIGYQRATIWERESTTMQTMAQLLQLSDDDLDELFTYAVTVAI